MLKHLLQFQFHKDGNYGQVLLEKDAVTELLKSRLNIHLTKHPHVSFCVGSSETDSTDSTRLLPARRVGELPI